ncbi:MAG: S8 family peptidase [Bacteroidetes bacterium]|nr:S8 family peptidase [Bacteroidota bacterium]
MKALVLSIAFLLSILGTVFSADKLETKKKLTNQGNLIVVKFKKQVAAKMTVRNLAEQFLSATSAVSTEPLISGSVNMAAQSVGLDRIWIYTVAPGADLSSISAKLNSNKYVEYAEPVYMTGTTGFMSGVDNQRTIGSVLPNDPLITNLHPLSQVRAGDAWEVQKGDSNVVIAIIDTGVDWDHEDLAGSIWYNPGETGLDGVGNDKKTNGIDDDENGKIDDFRGWDFVESSTTPATGEDGETEDNNPMDFNGHGSHVAGIAAGVTDNGIGIASLSWGVKLLPIRIGYHTTAGQGSSNSLFQSRAFIYAADMGADILNMSFTNGGKLIEDAGLYATQKGTLVVISAGNDNLDTPSELDVHPWAMTVSSVARTDVKAYYSSFGNWVKIAAPGGDQSTSSSNGFLSSVPYPSTLYGGKKYEYFQGTSMASPFVASLAGLIKSKFPEIGLVDLVERIKQTADNIDALNPGYIGKLGSGRINAYSALTMSNLTPAKPEIKLQSFSIVDSDGNGNGLINFGEIVSLKVKLQNDWGRATNLTATLTSDESWPLTINSAENAIGLLAEVTDTLLSATEITFGLSAASDGLPRIVKFSILLSADNGFKDTLNLELSVSPQILFVADFDDGPDYRDFYSRLLTKNNFSFDVVKKSAVKLNSDDLKKYQAVIWATGWSFPSLDEQDRLVLGEYLDLGGKLLISGQDLGWDLADPTGTEYKTSSGASKMWFEKYLKSEFIGDDNNQTGIIGVSGDILGNDISSDILMPEIAEESQYPDFVKAINGAHDFLTYPNGDIAGIRFESENQKLVYLPFGGLEAISDEQVANQLANRILYYLLDYSVEFSPLNNTENTTDPVTISAKLLSTDPIISADLYFSTTGKFPFTKTTMVQNGESSVGQIPAFPLGSTVYYFFTANTESGYITPFKIYSYEVKIDLVKPVVSSAFILKNTMDKSGNYPVSIEIRDESGIKPGSVLVHFSTSSGLTDSTILIGSLQNNWYSGSILIPIPVYSNTLVSYYFSGADASAAANKVRYPQNGTYDFTIGKSFVDDAENAENWTFEGAFGLATKRKLSGNSSIHNNKGTNYLANSNTTATLKSSFDFSKYASPALAFYATFRFGVGDTCFIEVNGGQGWKQMAALAVTDASMWTSFSRNVVSIAEFGGNANVQFRYHFISNSVHSGTNLGIYLDDLEVIGDTTTITSIGQLPQSEIPTEFSLSQNFPNPFNPTTSFYFSLPTRSNVKISVYDALGREVREINYGMKPAGNYIETFDASQLSSGIYFYVVEFDNQRLMKKMVLMK